MTEAEKAFRAISWLIIKWLLICLAVLLGLTVLAVGAFFAYQWYTYDRHAALVTSVVQTNVCTDPQYPLLIAFNNKSSKSLILASFVLSAKVPGRSSDIAQYRSLSSDNIVKPGEGIGNCWSLPGFLEPVKDFKTLEWSLSYVHYTFAD